MKNNLKFLREKSGFSQQKVADLLGVDRQTVIRHEKSSSNFYKFSKKYAELYGVSELQLISDISDLPEDHFKGAIIPPSTETEFVLDEDIVFKVQDIVSERLRANKVEIPAQNFSDEVRRIAKHTIEKMKMMKSDIPTGSLIDHIILLDKAGKL